MTCVVAVGQAYWCDYGDGYPWTPDPRRARRFPSFEAADAVAEHGRRRGLAPGQKGDPASRLPVTLGGVVADHARAVHREDEA